MGGAPDLFEAIAWGDRIAPQSDVPREGSVDDACIEPPARLSSTGLERPIARPKTQPVMPAMPAAAMPGESFGGLADALEPDEPLVSLEAVEPDGVAAGAAPLAEFDGLLGIFDGEPRDAPTTVIPAAPRPPALREVSTLPRPSPAPTLDEAVTLALPSVPRAHEEATTLALPALPRRATPVAAAPSRRPTPVPIGIPRPRPSAPSRAPSRAAVDFPAPGDAAESAQLVMVDDADGALLSRVAPRIDDEPQRSSRGAPVVWIALTLMLGGGLAWVLATQTDLLSGDVIASRNAAVAADVEREAAQKQAEIDAKQKEYGTIEFDTEPKGARVFELRDGPEATFAGLPVSHEYQVLVTAPGFEPRVRIVKGSELAAPVIVDLDPVAAGAVAGPIPDETPPKVDPKPSKDTATLTLRSNTAGAQLGLLVGFTPGVKIVDADVRATHRFVAVLAGFAPSEVTVKGRHFEESEAGALAYHETITLAPAAVAPAGAAAAVEEAADAEEEEDVVVLDEVATPVAAAAPAKPAATSSKKKSSKKKKKKKRRR